MELYEDFMGEYSYLVDEISNFSFIERESNAFKKIQEKKRADFYE